MTRYEYKVVPASARPPKIKGVRDPSERMRRAFEDLLNGLADQGWDYVRRDVMLVEAKPGFLRRKELREDTVLIFRREIAPSLAEEAEGAHYARFPRVAEGEADQAFGEPATAEGEDDADGHPEAPAASALDRPTGAQPLFARRVEAAREAFRSQGGPRLSARRDGDG